MAVRNIARGGGKAYKPQVLGLKELEKKLKQLLPDNPAMQEDLFKLVGSASDELRDQMKAAASSAGWANQIIHFRGKHKAGSVKGQEAIQSIFSYAKPRGAAGKRYRISALAGVSKRQTMVEWIAGRHPKSPRAKVSPGGAVAESFATMLEFGTTRRAPRPAIRNAIQTAKQRMIDTLTSGYNRLLEKYAK